MPAAGFIAMVGEAIKQLTGAVDFYLKDIALLVPLLLGETAVEIMTCLTPRNEPTEYEFSISSISSDGHGTTKHATGRGGAGWDVDPVPAAVEYLPRKVASASSRGARPASSSKARSPSALGPVPPPPPRRGPYFRVDHRPERDLGRRHPAPPGAPRALRRRPGPFPDGGDGAADRRGHRPHAASVLDLGRRAADKL